MTNKVPKTNAEILYVKNGSVIQNHQSEESIYTFVSEDSNVGGELAFTFPIIDISRFWHPTVVGDYSLPNLWSEEIITQLNYSFPLFVFFNESGTAQQTISYSETVFKVATMVGIHEETASIHVIIKIPAKLTENTFKVRFSTAKKLFHIAVVDARNWIYQEKDIPTQLNNSLALETVYSTWYSFHQEVTSDGIEELVSKFPEYNVKTLILDDGWQTEDHARRYAYAGDWKVAKSKFPQMKEHIKKIQKEETRYLFWMTLPYVGVKTAAFREFQNRILYFDEFQKAGVLDPRYPEVRKYLFYKIQALIQDLNIDGLKIDFIDSFRLKEEVPLNDEMDTPHLEVALLKLLTDIREICSAFKEDFLIEYREDYFGPDMNLLGDIIRVKDCPNDYLKNRVSLANLRLLSPKMAPHSDMIMFHPKDSLTSIIFQILNCLHGVIQLSVDLNQLTTEQEQTIKFWLHYQKKIKIFFLTQNLFL